MVSYIYEYFYLFNITIASLCLFGIYRKESFLYQLFFIFLYFTFHYTYGLVPFFESDFGKYFVISREVSRVEMVGIAALFFVIANSLICFKSINSFNLKDLKKALEKKSVKLFFILIILFVLLSLFFVFKSPTQFNIKTLVIRLLTIYSFLMIFLSAVYKKNVFCINEEDVRNIGRGLFSLLVFVNVLLLIQFFSGRAWVCCDLVRPSGLLFNPNNLGFWFFCVGGYFSLCRAEGYFKKLNYVAQLLVAIGLFLAAARALIIVTILFHILVFLISIKKKSISSFSSVGVGFLVAIYLFILSISVQFLTIEGRLQLPLYRAKLTADRIILTPAVLVDFLLQKLPVKTNLKLVESYQDRVIGQGDKYRKEMSSGGSQNIHGRMNSESTDNGLIAFSRESPASSFFWLLIFLYPVLISFFRKRLKGRKYFYAFYVTIFAASLSLNVFALMPSWVIVAMIFSVFATRTLVMNKKEIT